MTIELEHNWMMVAFQHGQKDACEEVECFETEQEALERAKWYAGDTPYQEEDGDYSGTEHEYVVFKAVATYRGKLTPKKHVLQK